METTNETVIRQIKYGKPERVPIGKIHTQQGPARSGKTVRANAWMAVDPENRRVVDGDRKEAVLLASQGYDVMLNLLG